jgi:amino acid transporter
MKLIDILFGRPLATSEDSAEKIGSMTGVAVFGLDALSSAAYGPEAALTLLIPLGMAGTRYLLPITGLIILLLALVYLSYRQTLAAYPNGGGSYTVARKNLGTFPGLLAGAALLIDYTLDAAVGISAGIGALVSAFPQLHPHMLALCLGSLLLLSLANLRGVRENGAIFLAPTYFFLACMSATLILGIAKAIASGGHPHAVIPPPLAPSTLAGVSAWILIRSFAGGCTALTGVEAVSNGVQSFKDDRVVNARRTLTIIIAALAIMLAGVGYLVKAYHIMAIDPNSPQYQSLLSLLLQAVSGRGWFYYAAIASILMVLTFSANTAFADFPRVCHFIAEDGYLPTSFTNRGRRLVYTEAIVVLTVLTAILLTVFDGVTDRLIPLFAVGAFLAFTMSQAGMVAHWMRSSDPHRLRKMWINLIGAIATGTTVLIVIVAKFTEGAWITVVAIPTLLATMYAIHRHYVLVRREIETSTPLDVSGQLSAIAVIPLTGWTRIGKDALRFAMNFASDVRVLQVLEENTQDELRDHWSEYVEEPAKQAGMPVPQLVTLTSPYRFVIRPIVNYVTKLAQENPDHRILVIVPEILETHWYYYFLHTQRAAMLKTRLLLQDNDRISVVNLPWHLKKK